MYSVSSSHCAYKENMTKRLFLITHCRRLKSSVIDLISPFSLLALVQKVIFLKNKIKLFEPGNIIYELWSIPANLLIDRLDNLYYYYSKLYFIECFNGIKLWNFVTSTPAFLSLVCYLVLLFVYSSFIVTLLASSNTFIQTAILDCDRWFSIAYLFQDLYNLFIISYLI